MRYSVPRGITLGLLSVWFLSSNGNPIVHTNECVDAKCLLSVATDFHIPHPDLSRRGGGGGRPDKPGDNTPNGPPGVHPNDPNNPSSPGDQEGEVGGFDGTKDPEGGFTKTCDKKRSWLGLWPRAGCEGDNPNPNPNAPPANSPPGNTDTQQAQFPPSVRNNNNQPATAGDKFVPAGRTIDVAQRKGEFERSIAEQQLEGRPWFFFSGIDYDKLEFYQAAVDKRLLDKKIIDQKTARMGDVLDVEGPVYMPEYNAFKQPNPEWFFWAANSKAYAQAIRGKVYVVMPPDLPINKPYRSKGSNWWSYEVPELTRSGRIDSITVIRGDHGFNMDTNKVYVDLDPGKGQEIWRRGQEPLGYPADEHYPAKLPEQPWNG